MGSPHFSLNSLLAFFLFFSSHFGQMILAEGEEEKVICFKTPSCSTFASSFFCTLTTNKVQGGTRAMSSDGAAKLIVLKLKLASLTAAGA